MTPLEKRLKEIPLRAAPAPWREEILAAAQAQKAHGAFAALLLAFENQKSKIEKLLWPHPYAWGALATCWMLIALLNFSGPHGEALYAVTPPGTKSIEISPERYAGYLRARDILLSEYSELAPTVWIERKKL